MPSDQGVKYPETAFSSSLDITGVHEDLHPIPSYQM